MKKKILIFKSLEERNISGQINLRPLRYFSYFKINFYDFYFRELTSKEVAFYNHYSNLNDKILIKKSTIEVMLIFISNLVFD